MTDPTTEGPEVAREDHEPVAESAAPRERLDAEVGAADVGADAPPAGADFAPPSSYRSTPPPTFAPVPVAGTQTPPTSAPSSDAGANASPAVSPKVPLPAVAPPEVGSLPAGEGAVPVPPGAGTGAGIPAVVPPPDALVFGPNPFAPAVAEPAAPKRPHRGLGATAVAGLVALAVVAGAVGGVAADRLVGGSSRPASATLPAASSPPAVDRPADSVAGIAATALPSVVSLQVAGADGVATGSGFILREDGYILTNNHVVAGGADGGEIVVLFADGHQSPAKIVGRTSDYDLAVVKVEDTNLTPLVLGDSDEVVVGDPVVAVGAPLGLNGTVTTGIVSALHRPVSAGDAQGIARIDAIQTDAAINPGNSGGPLVNGVGEVVGINSAIAQPPGSNGVATGSIGLGFAIPSNQARRTAEQLIETGTATYPVIGVLLDQAYRGEGVRVAAEAQRGTPPVTPDGPADSAGIRPGDVILSIDGRPVTESDELIVAIRAKAPGDAVTLSVRTGDEERDVRVVLDEETSE